MADRKYLYGISMNALAFPEWRGDRGEGMEIARTLLDDMFFDAVETGFLKDRGERTMLREWITQRSHDVIYDCRDVIEKTKSDISSEDPGTRKRSIDVLKKLMDDAVACGAKIFVISSGHKSDLYGEDEEIEEALDILCRRAKRNSAGGKMIVALETLEPANDPKVLLGPVKNTEQLAKRFVKKHNNFGLCYDLARIISMKEDYRDALTRFMPCLKYVRIGNCYRQEAGHPLYGELYPAFDMIGSEVGPGRIKEMFHLLDTLGYRNRNVPTTRPVVCAKVIPLSNQKTGWVVANIKDMFPVQK